MAEKIITNKQGVKISHANYVTLRNKNLIKLGIEDDLSTKLAGNSCSSCPFDSCCISLFMQNQS